MAGRYLNNPPRTEIKEVVKVVESSEVKEKSNKDEKRNVITEVIEKPDGTKISKIKEIYSNKESSKVFKENKSSTTSEVSVSKERQSSNTLSVISLTPKAAPWQDLTSLGILYQKELFLGITAGAALTVKGEYMLSLGLKF